MNPQAPDSGLAVAAEPAAARTDAHPDVTGRVALAAAVASALSACGGGGGRANAPAPLPPTPVPPPTPPALSANQAARFLQQASFNSTQAEIASLQSRGYAAWLDAEFAKPVSASNVDWLTAHGYAASEFIGTINGAQQALWQRLIAAPDALRQRIALALSEFFVVGITGVTKLPYRQFVMAAWWDLLCQHAWGN
jgi:uncharacterized protein (DUF1800 family)